MASTRTIGQEHLGRNMNEVIEQAHQGDIVVVVDDGGVEQVAILHVFDYRILRAVAAYHAMPPHAAPIADPALAPRGLDFAEMQQAIAEASGNPQAGWNRVLAAYLDADISLGRAAGLLGLSRLEMANRFQCLGLPLQIGPRIADQAREEFVDFGC